MNIKELTSDEEYIYQLQLAVRLLMSRIGDTVTFSEDDILEHRNDKIVFSRYEGLNGPTHVISKEK